MKKINLLTLLFVFISFIAHAKPAQEDTTVDKIQESFTENLIFLIENNQISMEDAEKVTEQFENALATGLLNNRHTRLYLCGGIGISPTVVPLVGGEHTECASMNGYPNMVFSTFIEEVDKNGEYEEDIKMGFIFGAEAHVGLAIYTGVGAPDGNYSGGDLTVSLLYYGGKGLLVNRDTKNASLVFIGYSAGIHIGATHINLTVKSR
ncbi:MAG TPA: hypothetical protein PKC21_09745 [Oligoflexia bacterium]|nr:hypothetical protein [Oligoflexia bacterium]HMR25621.1 hypothetical protein [Oligoflexia bacterium]